MEQSFAVQSTAFLYSLPLGAVLGIIYGIIALLRKTLNLKKGTVIALDITFMLLCAVSIFYFSLGFLDGYIRVYVIFGAGLGFIIYRLTIGRLLQGILNPILSWIKRIIVAIFTKIKNIAKKLLKIGYHILYNVGGRIVFFISNNLSINKRNNKRTRYGKKSKRKRSVGSG